MAATCTLLVALKNLTECLSLPSSLSYLNTEVDEVSTLLSLLYATFWFFFFFSRPILFLFSRFREGNVIKKICIGEKKLDSHEQNLLIFRGVCCLKKKTPAKGLLKNTSSTACAPAKENLLISIKRYYFAVYYSGLHFNRDRAWH